MEQSLVVGVDGSEESLRAVDWAADEAALRGLPLRLVYASLWEHYEGAAYVYSSPNASDRALADAILDAAGERAHRRNHGVRTTAAVLPQEPTDALLRESDGAAAVIVGSRGRGSIKGMLLGSVGLGVASWARCPVVVVRGDRSAVDGRHERILLGVGHPDRNSTAVEFAFREAGTRGSALDAVHAWRSPVRRRTAPAAADKAAGDTPEGTAAAELDEALRAARIGHPDVPVRPDTVEGPTHRVLVDRSAAADLLVVGARRNKGLGLQLSRTCHAVLHHAACPVAVVPQRV
ncbi:universal stress protein [Streptomyces sp. WM6378]|uniref:universal stress protein n=1 Tax=Streptomyces sp. WM6378 TaxID=1415557 RepID=UPI0006AFE360|nr:universal stress protein [Streptomyces sp. WM6378]KOU49251.1 universal stress protein [Streptomyces sp. WM6378]